MFLKQNKEGGRRVSLERKFQKWHMDNARIELL